MDAENRRQRWLALALLLLVLGGVYGLLLHPLWVQPLRTMAGELEQTRQRQARVQAELAQAPAVAAAPAEAKTPAVGELVTPAGNKAAMKEIIAKRKTESDAAKAKAAGG